MRALIESLQTVLDDLLPGAIVEVRTSFEYIGPKLAVIYANQRHEYTYDPWRGIDDVYKWFNELTDKLYRIENNIGEEAPGIGDS